MSYSEMLIARADGQLIGYDEYKNSWGFLALIWDVLSAKYKAEIEGTIPKSSSPFDLWPRLWKWAHEDPRPLLQPYEANVLVMSYDKAYTMGRENLLIYADSLDAFSRALVPRAARVNHLPQMAEALRKAVQEDGAEYVAWYGMSVSENLFFVREEDENGDVDDHHMLSFLNEDDLKKIQPSKWKMVPLSLPSATTLDCEY